jgi:hypothetical protein
VIRRSLVDCLGVAGLGWLMEIFWEKCKCYLHIWKSWIIVVNVSATCICSMSIADGLENWAMTCGRSLTIGVVIVVGNDVWKRWAVPTLR